MTKAIYGMLWEGRMVEPAVDYFEVKYGAVPQWIAARDKAKDMPKNLKFLKHANIPKGHMIVGVSKDVARKIFPESLFT